MRTICTATVADGVALPDAHLMERIAALSDKSAMAELDARYGTTLYAIAYAVLLDSDRADAAVAAAFREVWRRAGSFSARDGSVQRWLADLTRCVARECLRGRPRTAPRGVLPAMLVA